MLVDLIASSVVPLLHAIFAALPTVDLAALLGSVHDACYGAGQALAPLNHWLPLGELLTLAVLVTGVWMPATAVYVIANWVWRHVPTIMGFGTGAG
jgi:hypothetical protein